MEDNGTNTVRRRLPLFSLMALLVPTLAIELVLVLFLKICWRWNNEQIGIIVGVILAVVMGLGLLLRGRLRFGMKTMALLITICCMSVGIFGVRLKQARDLNRAVREIQKYGGKVTYDLKLGDEGWSVTGDGTPIANWVTDWFGESMVATVDEIEAERIDLTDFDPKSFRQFPELKRLALSQTSIGRVLPNEQLEEYRERMESRADAFAAEIGRLHKVEYLAMSGFRLTDDSTAHFSELTNLHTLKLNSTSIGDGAVTNLKKLRSLIKLDIRRTAVTEAGLSELQKAFPNVEIKYTLRRNRRTRQPKESRKVQVFKDRVDWLLDEARAAATLLTLRPSLSETEAMAKRISDLYAHVPDVPTEIDSTGKVGSKLKKINVLFTVGKIAVTQRLQAERRDVLDLVNEAHDECSRIAAKIEKVAEEIEATVGLDD